MGLLDARFAKLNFDYDRLRALSEAAALQDRMEITRSTPRGVELPFTVVEAGDSSIQVEYISQEWPSVGLTHVTGTWGSIGLTHIPGNEMSKLGRGSTRNKTQDDAWMWRDDISTPYLYELCGRLPFEVVGNVRLLNLLAGDVGSVHNDDPNDLFYSRGSRSVTLNLDGGGTCLEFLHNDKHYTIDDHPAFIFRDDCWHGAPKATRHRFQMRIHGRFKPEMETLIDQSKVLM